MTEDLKDGIYFSLPAETYHALPRLSASGVGNMLVGPPTYWASSWMNPDRQDKETKAKTLGAAYHVARLEPYRFHDCYVRELDPEDYPGCLMNGTQIGEALGEIGETKKRAGESVLEQAERLKAAGYGKPIWHILMEAWEEGRRERIGLPPVIFDQLMTDMERIQSNDVIRPHLENGYPEVSILWTCPNTGVPMKARIDYLQTEQYVDFKSFANAMAKPIDRFLSDTFMYSRYYIQAVTYHKAIEAIRALGTMNLVDTGDYHAEHVEQFLKEIYDRPEPLTCRYIFQEKDGIPNLLTRKIRLFNYANGTPSRTALFLKGDLEITYCQRLWKTYREEFGDDPWPPLAPDGEMTDDDFPVRWLEN